jgi:hypothetical protein
VLELADIDANVERLVDKGRNQLQAGTLRVCTGHAAPLLVVPEDGFHSHCRLSGLSLWGEEARPVDVSSPNTDQRCVFGPSNTYEGLRSTSPNYLRRVDPYASKGSAVPDRQLATPTSLFIYKYTRKYVQVQGFVCMRQKKKMAKIYCFPVV